MTPPNEPALSLSKEGVWGGKSVRVRVRIENSQIGDWGFNCTNQCRYKVK
jgi:hypothetical protein